MSNNLKTHDQVPIGTLGEGSRIDVHHHVHSKILQGLNAAIEVEEADQLMAKDRETSEQLGITTSILTATIPGLEYADASAAVSAARRLNDFCAKVKRADPEHYGFFATVPPPKYTDECIAEIRYALGELGADGITLLTQYDDRYLGHADYKPVWDELNKHKAVVFVHPTFCSSVLVNERVPQPAFDFLHETGRTALDLITSNMLRDHAKNTKIILSHGGGSLAALVERAVTLMSFSGYELKSAQEMVDEASSFYFDTALTGTAGQLAALQQIVRPNHILYGSDLPNAPLKAIQHFKKLVDESTVLSPEQKLEINGLAGRKLLPRLAR